MFELRTTPCADTKLDWEKDKSSFKTCVNPINIYHCIQDERNRSGEICIQPVWVQPRKCPEFNTGAWVLDTVPCNAATGCPNVTFLSNEAYKYPVCLNKTHTKEFPAHEKYSLPWFWIAGPVLLGLASFAIIAFYCFVRRRKREGQREDESDHQFLERKENSGPFHRTAAFHEAKEYLENGGKFLVLSGIWGSGKTKTAKEVYRSVTGKLPTIITDLEKFDSEVENQLALIFDEAFSRDLSNEEMKELQDKINTWFEKVSVSETKTFIIFTSIDDRKLAFGKILPVTSDNELKVINLNDRLTQGDRTQILNSHFTTYCPNKNFSKLEDLATKGKNESLGYPEICALYCRCEHFQKQGFIFCSRPLRYLTLYLKKMYRCKENRFLMLVYMSLNQIEIDIKNPDEMRFNGLEICKISNNTQAEPLVDTVLKIVRNGTVDDIHSLMSWEFVNKVPNSNRYRLQHDVIKRMTLIVFGTFHFDKLLELSRRKDLEGWIEKSSIVKTIKSSVDDMMPSLTIDGNKWLQYVQKMGWKTA